MIRSRHSVISKLFAHPLRLNRARNKTTRIQPNLIEVAQRCYMFQRISNLEHCNNTPWNQTALRTCIQVYMRPLEHRRIRYTPTTSIGFTMDTMIKPESCKKNDKTGVPGAKNTRTDKFSLHWYATHNKSLLSNIM